MIFDIIVLSVLFISAVVALLRGFIREVLTIAGVVGGALAAYAFGGLLSPVMLKWIGGDEAAAASASANGAAANGAAGGAEKAEKILGVLPPEMAANLMAYGLIFVIVVIILSIASHFLAGWARKIGLGPVDRSFGVLFGIVRGAVVLVLLYLPLMLIFDAETRAAWFKDSKTHHYVEAAAAKVAESMPEYDTEELKQRVQQEAGERTRRAVAEDARTRLLQLDELRQNQTPEGEVPPLPTESEAGYETEQRRDLNELILDNVDGQ